MDFSGRIVVLTGAAAGMGAATAELLLKQGATVYALDVAPITVDGVTPIHCDLGDRSSIDAALSELPPSVDVLMNCAGVPNGGRFTPEQIVSINWLGLAHLTEAVIEGMKPGSSVVHIASTAGRLWEDRVETHRDLVGHSSFEAGLEWVRANPELVGDGYAFSKETVQYYTLWRSVQLLHRGIRMNSLCPGITDTAIIDDFRVGMGDELIDRAFSIAGRAADPAEMAPTMLFLADEASSSYITGLNLNVDRGTAAARLSDQSDPAIVWPDGPQ